jgi:nitrite reductase (NO-forming)
LAGGATLAICGVSPLLTATWSAAPAPPSRVAALQRWTVAAGAAGVGAGRQLELGSVVLGVAGSVYLVGLGLLAALLLTTVRRGVVRRFDAAVAAYVLALAAGVAGVTLGVTMAWRGARPELRAAHATLNLLGLVGLVIAGTLPFFAATVGRTRMAAHAPGRRIAWAVAGLASALALAAVGLASGVDAAGAAGLGAYAAGIGAVLGLVPRPSRRALAWAGPRLVALWAGGTWWAAVVAVSAVDVATGDGVAFHGRWLRVLVVAGYAQILWGSLAYLLPMLRGGGHERLGAGFRATRSWTGLVAANAAGFAFAARAPRLATAAVVVWFLDGAVRAARVGIRPDGRGRGDP